MKNVAILLLVALLLAACGASPATSDRQEATSGSAAPSTEPMAPPMEEGGSDSDGMVDVAEAESPAGGELAQNQPALERKIIYTASLRLRVDDPRQTAEQLQGLAATYGGYVSSANIYEYSDGVYQGTVQLRVNAEQINAAIASLRDMATEVLTEQLDSRDVTDQYVDLQARIENLERTETELQILLTEAREQGGKTEDILTVYRELTSVREQIEVYQGQLNVLSDATTLATITVDLVPPEIQVEILNEEWSAMRTVREALRNLTEATQDLIDFSIHFTITVVPFLLLLALLGFLFLRFLLFLWRRRPAFLRPLPRPEAPPSIPDQPTT